MSLHIAALAAVVATAGRWACQAHPLSASTSSSALFEKGEMMSVPISEATTNTRSAQPHTAPAARSKLPHHSRDTRGGPPTYTVTDVVYPSSSGGSAVRSKVLTNAVTGESAEVLWNWGGKIESLRLTSKAGACSAVQWSAPIMQLGAVHCAVLCAVPCCGQNDVNHRHHCVIMAHTRTHACQCMQVTHCMMVWDYTTGYPLVAHKLTTG
jgi:hypothetical protein